MRASKAGLSDNLTVCLDGAEHFAVQVRECAEKTSIHAAADARQSSSVPGARISTALV
jgi:hypothetical protein